MTRHHDWQLLAPWYRWPLPAGDTVRRGRGTAPAIQKYDDSKLIDAFLADPQHSLRFLETEDRVHRLDVLTETVTRGPLSGFRKSMATAVPVRTDTRKLFLATHKRFYLVVFDLRCDGAGCPRANRDDVCEAGLVVRRRFITYPTAARAEAESILAEIARLQAALFKLDRPEPKSRRAKRVLHGRNGSNPPGLDPQRMEILQAISRARKELAGWAVAKGAETVSEGWIPSAIDGIGAWQPVQSEPQTLVEHVTPMHALIPDPRERRHSGRFGTLFFGLLPTASADHDASGNVRFDDDALYEVRCFVRRHCPECPRTGEPNDCGGQLFWSRPTEAYRLAPPFDLDGTSHRPITIKLPDLRDLAAQALSKPRGSASPVKFESPPQSSLQFSVLAGAPVGAGIGSGALTCFWSIPLITIVAMFLLNLFLPIVVLLFGMFWMLALKFCLGAAPGFSLDLDIVANLSALDDGLSDARINELRAKLRTGLDAHFGTPPGGAPTPGQKIDSDRVGSVAVATFQSQLLTPPSSGSDPVAGIEWEVRVEPDPELLEALA